MGRKPNPLILEYFVRGPKLNDNSNRYPHTCKQCGENFPKGRIDSLTTHITRKCPAISESDRMRACLELHGITNARAGADRSTAQGNATLNGQAAQLQNLPQGWSALETLAEASRQVDLSENSRVKKGQDAPNPANGDATQERFELQEQFTLDNPPVNQDGRMQNGKKGKFAYQYSYYLADTPPPDTTPPIPEMTPEERLQQAFLPGSASSPDDSNISVAVVGGGR